jgi:hypothetical protein
MSGAGGGMTTGPGGSGGGFAQSSNPFGGLNNTDLRPGRRRRRQLLNTSWVTRTKEPAMRKDVATLVDTLRDSVAGIVASGAPDMDQLLTKSFGEFGEALGGQLEEEYGPDPEPIGEGLDHIALFANGLAKMADNIAAIKGDEDVPLLDRFIDHGALVLKQLANDTAELPEDDQDIGRAEASGELVKIEGSWGEMLVKSQLPEEYAAYLTEPLDVLTEMATLGTSLVEDARDMADALLKQDPESIPEELVDALPLVFEKADNPFRRKRPDDARDGGGQDDDPDDGQDDQPQGGGRQAGPPGQGGGRQVGPPGQGAPGQDPGDQGGAPGDDMPQNPVETITKLASIIVVIAGSMQQAMGGDMAGQQDQAGGQGADIRNVGLQRGEPLLDQPLAKIFAGEAEINAPGIGQMTLFGAIEELAKLQDAVPDLRKQLGQKDEAFRLLKQRFDELAGQPVPSRGAAKPVAVSKGEDMGGGVPSVEADVATLEKLAKEGGEGGAAAKFLIGRVHQAGGSPLVPPN